MNVGERFDQVEEFARVNGYEFRRKEGRMVFYHTGSGGYWQESYAFYRPAEDGSWEICTSNRGSERVVLRVSEESSALLFVGLKINDHAHPWPKEIRAFNDYKSSSLGDFPGMKPVFDKYLESRYWSVDEVRPHSMLLKQNDSQVEVFYVTPEGELNLIVPGYDTVGSGAFVQFNHAWKIQYADKYVDEFWSERVPDFESVYRTVLDLNPWKGWGD